MPVVSRAAWGHPHTAVRWRSAGLPDHLPCNSPAHLSDGHPTKARHTLSSSARVHTHILPVLRTLPSAGCAGVCKGVPGLGAERSDRSSLLWGNLQAHSQSSNAPGLDHSVSPPSLQTRQGPAGAKMTPTLILLGSQVHPRADQCPEKQRALK